jgi:hypothetical protein
MCGHYIDDQIKNLDVELHFRAVIKDVPGLGTLWTRKC